MNKTRILLWALIGMGLLLIMGSTVRFGSDLSLPSGLITVGDATTAGTVKVADGVGGYLDIDSGFTAGAPTDATYITQTADGTLTNEQALALLATGILKNTTTTGVLSIAAQGTDYYAPSGTDVAIADGGTGASTAQAAIDALTQVSGATNEYVLTKDTATGNALWKVAAAGGYPVSDQTWQLYQDGTPANTFNLALDLFTTAHSLFVPDADGTLTTAELLSSTSSGEGASLIGIEDAGTYTSETDVEGALQELYAAQLAAEAVNPQTVLYSGYSEHSIVNTVAETTISVTGNGSLTVPAGWFTAGRTVKIRVGGVYRSSGSTTDTPIIRFKLGGTTVVTWTCQPQLNASQTDEAWAVEAEITCWATGASGTMNGEAFGWFEDSTGGSKQQWNGRSTAATVSTFDTTGTLAVSVTVQHTQADASNEIAVRIYKVTGT